MIIMSKIGYIRVSTERQETARQQEIMCGYQVDRIFSEKLSGANTDRPQLRAMLDYVRVYTPSRRSHLHGLSEPPYRTLRATFTE